MSHGHQNFQGFSSGSGAFPQEARINLNLEDVVLHEQKLSTILDVSTFYFQLFRILIHIWILESEKRCQCFLVLRGLVGPDGDD